MRIDEVASSSKNEYVPKTNCDCGTCSVAPAMPTGSEHWPGLVAAQPLGIFPELEAAYGCTSMGLTPKQ